MSGEPSTRRSTDRASGSLRANRQSDCGDMARCEGCREVHGIASDRQAQGMPTRLSTRCTPRVNYARAAPLPESPRQSLKDRRQRDPAATTSLVVPRDALYDPMIERMMKVVLIFVALIFIAADSMDHVERWVRKRWSRLKGTVA